MTRETSLDGDITTKSETRSSASDPKGASPEKVQKETDKQQESKDSKEKNETTNTVPFYKLFSFADSLDYLLMLVGTVGAVANGIAMPLMTIIFGNVVDAFGRTVNTEEVVHEVSKVLRLHE